MQTNVFEDNQTFTVKPFLRWAGGKTWFINQLPKFLPKTFKNYHEPFLGGGSVFLHLKAKGHIKHDAYLSDLNEELINCYAVLRTHCNDLFTLLGHFANVSECYYQVRATKPVEPLEKAAKFIYLNRTSFNGIYRVNRQGEYNVPFGNRTLSTLFEYDNMKLISSMLSGANFECSDFYHSINRVQEGDLVFLDPPYTIAHENNGFIEYNQRIFAWEDQVRLKEFLEKVTDRGAYFVLTNAAHFSIDNLYEGTGIKHTISRYSTIGGKGAKRKPCNEYIYTNYKPVQK